MTVELSTHIDLQGLPFHASAQDCMAPHEHALDCMADTELPGSPMERGLPFHGLAVSAEGME